MTVMTRSSPRRWNAHRYWLQNTFPVFICILEFAVFHHVFKFGTNISLCKRLDKSDGKRGQIIFIPDFVVVCGVVGVSPNNFGCWTPKQYFCTTSLPSISFYYNRAIKKKKVLRPFLMVYLILLYICKRKMRFGWLQCLLYLDLTFSLLDIKFALFIVCKCASLTAACYIVCELYTLSSIIKKYI